MRNLPVGLVLILICFITLAVVYNAASPPFENSDEIFHYPLIHHLAENNFSLPVQDAANIQLWGQEGSQPPLYHLISALLIKPLDRSDFMEAYRRNPHARIGIVSDANTNNNMIIHPLERAESYRSGSALGLRLVRLFSTLLASIVVAGTYYLAIYAFPKLPRWIGLLAAALVAFNPMVLFVASSVNNDNLANAIITSVLVWLTWLYRRDSLPPAKHLVIIGVLLGMGLISKLSMGPFMLIVGLYWLAFALKYRAFPYMFKWGCAALGIALLIAGWWYIRNYDLYGDPTGLSRFLDIVGRRPIDLTLDQLWSERHVFNRSFWGLFGALTVDMPIWIYIAFNILAAIAVIGAIIYFGRQALTKPANNLTNSTVKFWQRFDFPQVLLVLWVILSFLSVLRWTSMTLASQGRLWFVAIAALAVLSAVGLYEIGRRIHPFVAWIPAGFAAVIAVIAPFAWIAPAYAPPDYFAVSDATPPLVIYSDPELPDEQIALTRVEFPERVKISADQEIELEFCALTKLSRNWSVFVHMVNAWNVIIAQADFTPGYGKLPTSEIDAGQCWIDRFPMIIQNSTLSADTELAILVGLYDYHAGTRMVMEDGETTYLAQHTLIEAQNALQRYAFGGMLRLVDYEISESVINPGEELVVTLTWEVLAEIDADYTIFVQVLDPPTARKAAQSDLQPPGGTTSWQVGDQIEDVHRLMIASDAPAGVYAVMVGLYDQPEPGVFERLRLSMDGNDTDQDTLFLTPIRVEAE